MAFQQQFPVSQWALRDTLFPEVATPSKIASSELATPKMTTGRLASFLDKRTSSSGMGPQRGWPRSWTGDPRLKGWDPSDDDVRSQRPPHDPKVLQHLRHPHAKHSKSPQWIKIMKAGKCRAIRGWTVCGRPFGRLEPCAQVGSGSFLNAAKLGVGQGCGD